MKLFVFAALGCAVATPALAQSTDFNGPYAGVSIGYGAAKSESDVTLSGDWVAVEPIALQDAVTNGWSTNQSTDGIAFGGQLGYNALVGSNVVIGAEVAFHVLDADETSTRTLVYSPTLSYDFSNHVDAKNLLALKAKLGFVTGSTLIYATGGYATGKAELGAEVLSDGGYAKAGSKSKWMDGYVIGGGVEHKFTPNLGVRLEYNYADLGHETYDTAYLPGSTFAPPIADYGETFSQDLRLHLVSLGVNFHF